MLFLRFLVEVLTEGTADGLPPSLGPYDVRYVEPGSHQIMRGEFVRRYRFFCF